MKKYIILIFILAILLTSCGKEAQEVSPTTVPTEVTVETPLPTEPETTQPEPTEPPFIAQAVADTDPKVFNTQWEIYVEENLTSSYTREDPIFFENTEYFALPGVSSYRGGHYRTDASYGTATIQDATINSLWKMNVGYLSSPNWGGCCWTGQPLVVQWDEETKQHMNLYEEKKAKEDLVEVIYAKADGYIHFFDLEDGSATRDALYMRAAFKGSGSLDPRGYPILYAGSGLIYNGFQKIYAISLIDGSILYEHSGDESQATRIWYAFDGGALVDAETDTLLWGGESGIFYSIKLNTNYNPQTGELSMNPDQPVMTYYHDDYTEAGRNHGYESSVTAVENYLYIGTNAGTFQCIDANTMAPVWMQDLKDDINATAVFDWGSDLGGYLYTAPSMDYSGYQGIMPLYKLDARTGEIIWQHDMECGTMTGIPGGALASPLLGRSGSNIENIILYSMGCSPNAKYGQVVAMDKDTGEVIWQFETSHYMWSSPVALYTPEGKSYIFQADSRGICYLLDGATGELLDRIDIDRTVEASPVAFGNRIVLGTRSSVYLFEIT
jgi:outer membrane protein assembly factor BamB